MRIGGFLITPEEGLRWTLAENPDLTVNHFMVTLCLGTVVSDHGAKFVVATYPTERKEDFVYFIPTRQAPFSRQSFRDIGRDARGLESFKWGEDEDKILRVEDKIQTLIKEHGLKAEFTTIYVEDSRWAQMMN